MCRTATQLKNFIKYAFVSKYKQRVAAPTVSSSSIDRNMARGSTPSWEREGEREGRGFPPLTRHKPSTLSPIPLYAFLSRGDSAISMRRFNFVGSVRPGLLKFQSTIPDPRVYPPVCVSHLTHLVLRNRRDIRYMCHTRQVRHSSSQTRWGTSETATWDEYATKAMMFY